MRIAFRTLIVLAVIVEVVVVAAMVGGVRVGMAGAIPVAFLAAALAVLWGTLVSDKRRYGSWAVSLGKTSSTLGVPRKPLAMLVAETQFLRSVPSVFVGPQRVGQTYSKALRVLVAGIVPLVVVEVVVVHLAVPSQMWRTILFVVSAYALLVFLGFYGSMKANPHLLLDDEVVIRHGARFECRIPTEKVKSITAVRAGSGGRPGNR